MKKISTLCIIREQQKVLLGMKKRGFGEGRWNGFGGKVKEGEDIEGAAKREVLEEAGIEAGEMTKRGVINFEFEGDPNELEVHIFEITTKFEGEPAESDEMRPKWFSASEIPFDKMWPDDRYWMPLFLAGKKFQGRFLFDKPSNQEYTSRILEKELYEN